MIPKVILEELKRKPVHPFDEWQKLTEEEIM